MLMKTQDIGYILQKLQSERKKIEKLTAVLHSVDNHPSNRHIYYAEDRKGCPDCIFVPSYALWCPVFTFVLMYALPCLVYHPNVS
ncbi:hypothetical protein F383_32260 [Gossypium arboreum]|nr:hypothetical protein F383_32260 [Gossypium arboreum]